MRSSSHSHARLDLVWLSSLLLAIVGTGCSDAPPDASGGTVDLSHLEIIDLTHAYDERTLYWPTSPGTFQLTSIAYGIADGGYFYSANTLCTPEHGGTHLDAPIHFAEDGWTAGEVPLSRLSGPAVVIDVSAQAATDPDYRLTVADIEGWEARHGSVPTGAIVLARTGWSSRWPNAERYLGHDRVGDASNLRFPGYGEDATRVLVEDRGVAAIGIDTASIDHGLSSDFIAHQVAAAANVVALENVANLESLPDVGAWILALPMKIQDGSGGPVRIVGLLP